MKNRRVNVWTILLVSVSGLFLSASAAQAATSPGGAGYLDALSNTFQLATMGWATMAQGYAKHIFASLAVLDLAWWGIKNVLKKNDLADFIGGATLKISSIFFFYTIVSYAPTWMPLITSSFMQMGQGIGGATAIAATPSGVMSNAFGVINQLWTVYDAQPGGLDHVSQNFINGFNVIATSLLALIGFGLVALQLLMTQIEMYLVGGAGLVMLGFTGSGMTSSFGEKYIGYMISIGIKLLVIYAIVGLGNNLIIGEGNSITTWAVPPHGSTTPALPPLDVLTIGVSMLIYGVIGMQVPGMAGSLMNGSPNMSLGNVAGGAAAIAGGVAAAGAAAVAGAAGAAQGLAKMADLVGAGVSGAGAAGGIGGADSLGALSSMTGASSSPTGSLGVGAGEGQAAFSPASSGGGASTGSSSSGLIDTSGSLGQALSARTGGGGEASAASATSSNVATTSSTAPSFSNPSVSVPASGAVDAMGAGAQPGSGASSAKPGEGESAKEKDGPWKTMGKELGKLADKKDDIARHEGSTGGGIQIRLNHTE